MFCHYWGTKQPLEVPFSDPLQYTQRKPGKDFLRKCSNYSKLWCRVLLSARKAIEVSRLGLSRHLDKKTVPLSVILWFSKFSIWNYSTDLWQLSHD